MWIKKFVSRFFNIRYRWLLNKSIVIIHPGAKFTVADNVKILNCKIVLFPGASLTIETGCHIKNVNMSIGGNVSIGKNNIIENGYAPTILLKIDSGSLSVGNNNRIRSNILLRFDGSIQIADYNNINEETEIRCDEKIEIGSFNQISYKCIIWDTNTHNIYSDDVRRELTKVHFPIFGYEYERPKTKPIFIGDDCWIGRESSILKGVRLNNSCIVGFKTILSNCVIEPNKTVISKSNNTIIDRSY